MQAFTGHTVSFIVRNLAEGRGGATANDAGAAVGDAAISTWLSSTGVASTRVCTEFGCNAALAPDIAACVERAGIQVSEFCSIGWALSSWDLGAADGVVHDGRHRGVTLAQTDVHVVLQILAPIPGPGVLVKLLQVIIGQTVGCRDLGAVVILGDVVRVARTICVGLWAKVWQVTA